MTMIHSTTSCKCPSVFHPCVQYLTLPRSLLHRAGIQEQVSKQASQPSVQHTLPEIVSGLDGAGSDYDSEEEYRAAGGGNSATAGDSDDGKCTCSR
jgi:hypothetical protein